MGSREKELFKKTHKLSKEEKRRIEYWKIKLNLL